MRKFLTLFGVLMLTAIAGWAQSVFSGYVRDVNNIPIAGVRVYEEGNKTNGTVTDGNGIYTLSKITGNTNLVFELKGFLSVTSLAIASKDVSLLKDPNFKGQNNEGDIVVTALGANRQKAKLGYASATIKATELVQAAPVNLANAFTGKVSGLTTFTPNSGVLGETRITLRGIRSLTGNNQPLLILNGVPVALGFLNSINPNDVESSNVLKSSAATAIYGADGVNGAIVITTKRGSKLKPSISVSHTTQLESISYLPKFQTEFGSGYDFDAATGQGYYTADEQQSFGDRFDGSMRQAGVDGPGGEKLMIPYSNVKNGRRNFWETGITNQTDVSFSTGDFYVSAQNVNIKGTVGGDENTRRTFTVRAEKEYNKFKAIFNVNYTNGKYNVTTANRDIYYGVTGAPGQYDLSRFKNWRTDFWSKPENFYTWYLAGFDYTPYMAKDINRQAGKSDDILANTELSYKVNNWMNVVYRLSGTYSGATAISTTEAFLRPQHLTSRGGDRDISSTVFNSSSISARLTSELFLNFKKTITNKVKFDATVGYSARSTTASSTNIGSNNLGQSTLLSINSRVGEILGSESGPVKTLVQRTFARAGFEYDDWASLELTGSYDQDSRLVGVNEIPVLKNISFAYGGVNGAIQLHKAIPALMDNKYLSSLKLRGAITKSGNVNLGAYSNETPFGTANFFPYGSVQGNILSTTRILPSYKPEFVLNKEIGIEMGFLNGRIGLEVSAYRQDNSNQVINVNSSLATGTVASRLNAAEFTNSGLEVDLRLTPLVKIGKVNIDLKANYTKQTSNVTSLFGDVNELAVGNGNFAVVGSPAYRFKITDYNRDDQGRVIVDPVSGMPSQKSDLTFFGQTTPTDILGITINVNWKNFGFTAVAEHRGGNQMLAQDLGSFLDGNGISARSAANGRRAFIFPNSSYLDAGSGKYVANTDRYTTSYGRTFWNSTAFNEGIQSNYIASGAFWKLRELAINYSFSNKLFGRSGIKGATLALTGRNLLMIVPKSNVWTDPEFSTGTGNAQGFSTGGNMPPTRIYGLKLALQL